MKSDQSLTSTASAGAGSLPDISVQLRLTLILHVYHQRHAKNSRTAVDAQVSGLRV